MKKAISIILALTVVFAMILPMAASASSVTIQPCTGGTVTYTTLPAEAGSIKIQLTPESESGYVFSEVYITGKLGAFESVLGYYSTADMVEGKITATFSNTYESINVSAVFEEDITILMGDMDNDKEITVTDALIVLRIAAKLSPSTPETLKTGDMDDDKEITVTDALIVLRIAAKLA